MMNASVTVELDVMGEGSEWHAVISYEYHRALPPTRHIGDLETSPAEPAKVDLDSATVELSDVVIDIFPLLSHHQIEAIEAYILEHYHGT